VGIVFHETETTRGFVEPVQSHNQTLDLPTFCKELMNLLLGGVERPAAIVSLEMYSLFDKETHRFPT
jgi:hypothetical protein